MKKKGFTSKVLFFSVVSLSMITAFIIVGAGCGSSGGADGNSPTDPTGNEIIYLPQDPKTQRNNSPNISEYKWRTLVEDNTDFALEFYDNIASGNSDNIFFSPYSISMTLAMAYAGAQNSTERQMADALNFNLSQDYLHTAFNYLDTELASRRDIQDKNSNEVQKFNLTVDNSLWGQTDYNFTDQFLDVLAVNYGAGLKLLNFSKYPEDSRVTINDWISKQTEGNIENLIRKGTISSDTHFVLTNTIYFNASWKIPFDETGTQNAKFNLLDGGQEDVSMMSGKHDFKYTKGSRCQAVELKYYGDGLSMLIILPDTGRFEEFENSFNASELNLISDSLKEESVELKMPKFSYKSGTDSLKETFKGMGMQDAFKSCGNFPNSKCSDFSGMDGTRELFISDIAHKAFISVDEEGTEAGAVTSFPGPGSSDYTITLTIDRPFIFFIRDADTKAILFMGRIMNPEEMNSGNFI
ncbi:MAG: serpin family protein [Desulfobacterales bacterium]|nr:serpin family protein [Desulfobacterales bacterium]